MRINLKPLGLQDHLTMHHQIGRSNPSLGERSPLGMSSDWIQTFPVLQLSIEHHSLLSQTANVYDEFDFSTATQTTLEKPQQNSASTNTESPPIQAKGVSEYLVSDSDTVADNAPQTTEILSLQINRLPLAPQEPLGSRAILKQVSERSTDSIDLGADISKTDQRSAHASFSDSVETPVETTNSDAIENSVSELPQSETANLLAEKSLPAPPHAQFFVQTQAEPNTLDFSALPGEVETERLSSVEDTSVAADAGEAGLIQPSREPIPTPDRIKAVSPTTVAQSTSESVEPVEEIESTISAKPDEGTTSLETNSLNIDTNSKALVLDSLAPSNESLDDTASPSIKTSETNSENTHPNAVDGNLAGVATHSTEINLKPNTLTPSIAPDSLALSHEPLNNVVSSSTEALQTNAENDHLNPIDNNVANVVNPTEINLKPDRLADLPTQAEACLSESTNVEKVEPKITLNEQVNISSQRLTSLSEAPSSLNTVSPASSELIAEKMQPIPEQSSFSEEMTRISPETEPASSIEPAELRTDTVPASRSTVSEPTIDRAVAQPAAPITSTSPESNLARVVIPLNLSSSNITSEEPAINYTAPIQAKSEDIQQDNKNVIAENAHEITKAPADEAAFQTLPPLGMSQSLALSRLITPPSITPAQEPSSQAQSEEQPLSSERSSTIARRSINTTPDAPATRESSKADEVPDSWSSISDLLNQSSTKNSEEKATLQNRSWQDVASSLTDVSNTSTIQKDLQEFTESDISADAKEETAETLIHPRLEQTQPEMIATTSPQPTSPKNSAPNDEQLEQLAWAIYHQLRQRLALDSEQQGQLTNHPPWVEVVIPSSQKATHSSTNDQSISNTIEMLSPTNVKLSHLVGEVYYRVRSRLNLEQERHGLQNHRHF